MMLLPNMAPSPDYWIGVLQIIATLTIAMALEARLGTRLFRTRQRQYLRLLYWVIMAVPLLAMVFLSPLMLDAARGGSAPEWLPLATETVIQFSYAAIVVPPAVELSLIAFAEVAARLVVVRYYLNDARRRFRTSKTVKDWDKLVEQTNEKIAAYRAALADADWLLSSPSLPPEHRAAVEVAKSQLTSRISDMTQAVKEGTDNTDELKSSMAEISRLRRQMVSTLSSGFMTGAPFGKDGDMEDIELGSPTPEDGSAESGQSETETPR